MTRFVLLFLVSSLLVSPALSHALSQQTRNSDVSRLEKLSLPFRLHRRRRGQHVVENLVDFLASRRGLMFLASQIETLWYQELLETQYGRRSMCVNIQNAEARKNGLTEKEQKLKNCLCRFYMPFLHCLAISSQLLREAGLLNGEDLNINLSEQTLSNKGKPMETSTLNQTLDNNSVKPLATKEDRSDCIPRFDKTDDGVVFGGHCTVPIAGLMTIEFEQRLAMGHDEIYFYDAPDCKICAQPAGGVCQPLCKDFVELVEQLVDNASARLETKVCLNFSKVGEVFSTIFGVDGCFTEIDADLFFYQRLLHLNFNAGMTNWRLVSELKQKLEDGPKCSCQLETFRCIDSCMMKKDDVVGVIGIEWDFFFGKGSYKREFYKPRDCYSKHIHRVPECPTKSPSPSAVVR